MDVGAEMLNLGRTGVTNPTLDIFDFAPKTVLLLLAFI